MRLWPNGGVFGVSGPEFEVESLNREIALDGHGEKPFGGGCSWDLG